jgi:flagellar protein FlaF
VGKKLGRLMGISAYRQTIAETASARQIEKQVLISVTRDLDQFCEIFDATENKVEKIQILASGLRHSLWKNEQLWMSLKTDLTEPGNRLEPGLKGTLISLALWVERHTLSVMEGKAKVFPLVEMNKIIANGLTSNVLAGANT